jgi:hypothetical protein
LSTTKLIKVRDVSAHALLAEVSNRVAAGHVRLNTKRFEKTHDEVKSQGWTALILDTNGNGKRDAYAWLGGSSSDATTRPT